MLSCRAGVDGARQHPYRVWDRDGPGSWTAAGHWGEVIAPLASGDASSLLIATDIVRNFCVELLVLPLISVSLSQYHRIIPGHLIFQELPATNRPDSFHQVQGLAVWSAGVVQPGASIES